MSCGVKGHQRLAAREPKVDHVQAQAGGHQAQPQNVPRSRYRRPAHPPARACSEVGRAVLARSVQVEHHRGRHQHHPRAARRGGQRAEHPHPRPAPLDGRTRRPRPTAPDRATRSRPPRSRRPSAQTPSRSPPGGPPLAAAGPSERAGPRRAQARASSGGGCRTGRARRRAERQQHTGEHRRHAEV